MNPHRLFQKIAVVFSLIMTATIVISPTVTQSAPEAPDQPPVIIDLEISLHKTTVPAADRTKYENIINRLADAIFEASEGENKIGKVTFYLGGTCADKADIVWIASCHPSGAISGRAVNGQNINFCDNFPGSMNFLTHANGDQGGGYTLGHEMGHYYYSMYDEYVGNVSYDTTFHFPHSTDDAIDDAIMNDQWDAIGGNYEWLNFSTANSYSTGDETAQNRVYGASCWETLARAVSADPRDGQRATLPVRIHHPELAAVAPTGTNDPDIDLPDTAARSDVEIVWGSCSTAYQIVIDKSGSMTGNKLPNVKAAAKMLVDLAPVGYSTIGVIAYNHNITVVQPLTAITSAADKTTIKDKIDLITRGGNTAIGDAAQKAHDDLVAASGLGNYNKTVYLLSDGNNTAGSNPVSVIPSYQASNIPIYAFAYGADADTTLMQKLATDTNGKYYSSPTSLVDITNAFQDANLQSSPSVGITKGTEVSSILLGPEATDDIGASFMVDSTLGHFDVVVVYTGAYDDMTFRVEHSLNYYLGGDLVCSDDDPSVVKERMCYYGRDLDTTEPYEYGEWNLYYTNYSGEGTRTFSYHVTGYPDPDQPDPAKRFTYTASVTAFPYLTQVMPAVADDFIKLPQPVKLVAVLSKTLPIKGAEAVATIAYQDGTEELVPLLDNGKDPDNLPNDGLYTGVFFPEVVGAYNVSVQFTVEGGAAETKISHAPSHPIDGGALPIEPPDPIPDNYVDRNASIQVTVLDYDKVYLPLVENQ